MLFADGSSMNGYDDCFGFGGDCRLVVPAWGFVLGCFVVGGRCDFWVLGLDFKCFGLRRLVLLCLRLVGWSLVVCLLPYRLWWSCLRTGVSVFVLNFSCALDACGFICCLSFVPWG